MQSESPQFDDRPPLERDLQAFLADNLGVLGQGLTLIGTEQPVPFGRVDILAQDHRGDIVAVELKIGVAGRDAVGQLQSYMGALQDAHPTKFVRGILVAAALDAGAEAALRVVRDIEFYSFQHSFALHRERAAESTRDQWLNKRSAPAPAAEIKRVWVPESTKWRK